MTATVSFPIELSNERRLIVFVDSKMRILIPNDLFMEREVLRREVVSAVAEKLLVELEHTVQNNLEYDLEKIAKCIKAFDNLHAYYPDEL